MRRLRVLHRYQERKITGLDRESDGRIRYGGAWVSAASALPLNLGVMRPRPLGRFMAAAVRQPRRLSALIALLVRTPTEYVALSGTAAGEALDDYFSQRSLGVVPWNRFCRGLLFLPEDHAAYLRGRRRQALRTNLRRAADAGIECEVVTDPRRAIDDISHVLRRQWNWLADAEMEARLEDFRASVTRSEVTTAVARDEDGRPLAVATTVIDNFVCLITHAVATSHEARWALHDHLVQLLIARRVRYLLAEGGGMFGVLGFATNVQHYQHLLGYELRHVVPDGRRGTTRRRRLVASLVLAMATAGAIAPQAAAGLQAPTMSRTGSVHALHATPRPWDELGSARDNPYAGSELRSGAPPSREPRTS